MAVISAFLVLKDAGVMAKKERAWLPPMVLRASTVVRVPEPVLFYGAISSSTLTYRFGGAKQISHTGGMGSTTTELVPLNNFELFSKSRGEWLDRPLSSLVGRGPRARYNRCQCTDEECLNDYCSDMFMTILPNGNLILMGGDSCTEKDEGAGKYENWCKRKSASERESYFLNDLWEFQVDRMSWVQHYEFTPFGKVQGIVAVGYKVYVQSSSQRTQTGLYESSQTQVWECDTTSTPICTLYGVDGLEFGNSGHENLNSNLFTSGGMMMVGSEGPIPDCCQDSLFEREMSCITSLIDCSAFEGLKVNVQDGWAEQVGEVNILGAEFADLAKSTGAKFVVVEGMAVLIGGMQDDRIWTGIMGTIAFDSNDAVWKRLTVIDAPSQLHNFIAVTQLGVDAFVFGGVNVGLNGRVYHIEELELETDCPNAVCPEAVMNARDEMWKLTINVASRSGVWTSIAKGSPWPPARYGHGLSVYGPDTLLMFGGSSGQPSQQPDQPRNDLWKFTVSTESWQELSSIGPVPSPRRFFGFAVLDGSAYVVGGECDGRAVDEVWTWNGLRWSMIDSARPSARALPAVTVGAGKIWLYGGTKASFTSGEDFLSDLWSFDPLTRKWTESSASEREEAEGVKNSPSPRIAPAFVSVGRYGLLVGGSCADSCQRFMTAEEKKWHPAIWRVPIGAEDVFPTQMIEFLFVYDQDLLRFGPQSAPRPMDITLCSTDGLPCALSVGDSQDLAFGSSITCSASVGCQHIHLSNVNLACSADRPSDKPPFQVSGDGAFFNIKNSVISNCVTASDGGFMRTYDRAIVSVKTSTFTGCSSGGKGGVLCARGAFLTVEDSVFRFSQSTAGGAIFASSLSVYPNPAVAFSGCFLCVSGSCVIR